MYTMKMETKEFDTIIIGGGPAGLMASVYSARSARKTLVIEAEICGGQITITGEIENMPGFTSISGPELAMNMIAQAEHCGVQIAYETVEELDFAHDKGKLHTIKTHESIYKTKTVIVTTGAGPRKLGLVGEAKFEGRGVHYCSLCDGAFYKDRDVVVVGGGNTAVEDALYLTELAKSVTMIDVAEKSIAHAVMLNKLMAKPNFYMIMQSAIVEINGDKRVENIDVVNLKDQKIKTIPVEGVFVAIGRIPNSKMFKDKLDFDKYGYIKANTKMETNIPGIYAAGDITDKQVRQIVTACGDGAVAAINADLYIKEHF